MNDLFDTYAKLKWICSEQRNRKNSSSSKLERILGTETLGEFNNGPVRRIPSDPSFSKSSQAGSSPSISRSSSFDSLVGVDMWFEQQQEKHEFVILIFYRGNWCLWCKVNPFHLSLSEIPERVESIHKLPEKEGVRHVWFMFRVRGSRSKNSKGKQVRLLRSHF